MAKKLFNKKRAEIGALARILLWVVFFLIALGVIYAMVKFVTSG